MNTRRLDLFSTAAAGMLLFAGCGGGGGGGARAPDSDALARLQKTVQRGNPALAPAEGYAGSAACIACHLDTYETHERTAHHRGLRSVDRPGVSGTAVHANLDGEGRDDFRAGLDLGSTPEFSSYGNDAPRLSRVAGDDDPYKVEIAGVTYDVALVYGGQRTEAYLLRVGDALYAAPFEFDVENHTYRPWEPDVWYDGSAPRFTSGVAAVADIDRAKSFERRCAACHQTGFRVENELDSGQWRTGYAELGVGCESCHGPGAAHAVSLGDPALITNPRSLDNGTADGRRRANAVCAQCHTRGEGATLASAPAPVAYAWSTSGGFRPGALLDDYVTPTQDPGHHWGLSDGASAAARAAGMQGQEINGSAHAPDGIGTPLCMDCHDAHGRSAASQVLAKSTLFPDLDVSDADGSLCLSCHVGTGPFATTNLDDVRDLVGGNAEGVVSDVIRHMANVGMAVPAAAFDPAGTGVGRCSACHMPATVTEFRPGGTDEAGHTTGGRGAGSHGFIALWPSASEALGVTNACSVCHPTDGNDSTATLIEQWREDGADGDGVHHGAATDTFHDGVLASSTGSGRSCVRCHTTAGFRAIVLAGDPTGLASDPSAREAVVARAVRLHEGITCAACHGEDEAGVLAQGSAPLRLPMNDICSDCHDDGVRFSDYDAVGQSPHAPQQSLFAGVGGAEPPGSGPYSDSVHTTVADSCVHCHLDRAKPQFAKHSFEPTTATCGECHPSATSFDLIAFGNYDGDGSTEGLQTEVAGLLDLLRDAILAADGQVSLNGQRFVRGAGPGGPGATPAVKRAAFNWETVVKDGSAGVHNPSRIVRLLQKSYREVTGNDVPGAVLK